MRARHFSARALALLALMGGMSSALPEQSASTITQEANENAAMPAASKAGKRSVHEITSDGLGSSFRGAVTGHDWIYRRTNNFRRRGVGSLWKGSQGR